MFVFSRRMFPIATSTGEKHLEIRGPARGGQGRIGLGASEAKRVRRPRFRKPPAEEEKHGHVDVRRVR